MNKAACTPRVFIPWHVSEVEEDDSRLERDLGVETPGQWDCDDVFINCGRHLSEGHLEHRGTRC